MKAFKTHPLPLKPGYDREVIIELSYKELEGLADVITESLDLARKDKKILLDFCNNTTADNPYISAFFYDDKSKEGATE